jgi:predicted dehydrogenase
LTRTDSPFTVALLGCGAVVQDLYLPALKAVAGDMRVTHCYDLSSHNSGRVAEELGAVAVTGGLEALLAGPRTDGVIISTPNTLHAKGIIECLKAGRHVYCEKPVATRSDECDAIEQALAGTDRVLTVNLVRRCFPASAAMRHLVRNQVVGRPLRIEAVEGGRGGWNSRSGFQFSRDSSGGGVTMDRGSHMFDLLVNWFGVPRLVGYTDDAIGGCEATSIAELAWPDGPRATVRMSKVEAWGSTITVEGEHGLLEWTPAQLGSAKAISRGDSGLEFEATVRPREGEGNVNVFDALAKMLRLWMGTCRGANPNPTPFNEVRASIDIIQQCYAQRQPAQPMWLEYQD